MRVPGVGPDRADVVIVGESPGYDEELEGKPFVGVSGQLLTKVLRECGISRERCYITNVCKERPLNNDMSKWLTDKKSVGKKEGWPLINGRYAAPQVQEGLAELFVEVASREPKIIVGLGNTALWAFAGEWGITDWRGSEMRTDCNGLLPQGCAFVPTLHPAGVLRSWPTRAMLVHDLTQRVARRVVVPAVEPVWQFNIAPTYQEVRTFLRHAPASVAVDVETSRGQIVCIGIATSRTCAMCIPFVSEGYGAYWRAAEQAQILQELAAFLKTRAIIGQNFNYDASYFQDNFEMTLRCAHDTKIAQNVLFPGTPANLGFLSSMHCDWHCYWKDDARDWQNLREFNALFRYNCRDVCSTFEIAGKQYNMLQATRLLPQFEERMRYSHAVFDMQQCGLLRSPAVTKQLCTEIAESLAERAGYVCEVAGAVVNLASPLQISKLLYTQLGCRRPLKTASGTDDEALKQVAKWHPEHERLCTSVHEWRALASVRNNFLNAKLDPDGQLRSSFLTTGTETFRLTSSKNNFGRGANLLNISGNGFSHSGNKLPNLRRAIVPPEGYTIFDCDLARADLQVVVWEAEDAELKCKLREGVDIHTENARDVFGVDTPTAFQREMGKKFVHLSNYGGGARTCAVECGVTVHEADMSQRRWFAAHPGIKRWHTRTQKQLEMTRTVHNKFGYRIVFMDRVDNAMFRAALAWVPQSTIAILTSLVHMRIDAMRMDLGLTVLLQMYDSVMGMYPTRNEATILTHLFEATRVVVPYDDPLVIDMGLKTSTTSWGDCEKRSWLASAVAA